jgi:ribosomal protein L37AE/L43A
MYPFTRSGKKPDKALQGIIENALRAPNPKCPQCQIEGVIRGSGEVAWCECPKCGQTIGASVIM